MIVSMLFWPLKLFLNYDLFVDSARKNGYQAVYKKEKAF